jgi:hypothetical protein
MQLTAAERPQYASVYLDALELLQDELDRDYSTRRCRNIRAGGDAAME